MKPVVQSFGLMVVILAAMMVLAAAVGFYRDGPAAGLGFLFSAIIALFVGGALMLATARSQQDLTKRQSYVLLFLFWLGLPPVAALPLWLGPWSMPPLHALFEAVSALTTTGFSVFHDLSSTSDAVMFWRALLQWAGGLMTVVLMVAVLTNLNLGGLQLFRSAIPYGERGGTVMERLLSTSRSLLLVYSGLTGLCAIALWLAGMSVFDALCLALSTVSTGGFVTPGASAALVLPAVQTVLLIFMVVGALNLTTLWALANRRTRPLREDPEARYMMVAIAVLAFMAVVALYLHTGSFFVAFDLEAVFLIVSAVTTAGFVIPGVETWGMISPVLIIGLLLAGGCTASTSGGMRLLRIAVLFKQARRELYRLNHPHGVLPMRLGTQRIDDQAIWGVWSYFFALIGFVAVTAIALSGLGLEPLAAISAAVAALTNAGPFAAVLAPEIGPIAALADEAKAVLVAAMLSARLELLTLLILLSPAYWQR